MPLCCSKSWHSQEQTLVAFGLPGFCELALPTASLTQTFQIECQYEELVLKVTLYTAFRALIPYCYSNWTLWVRDPWAPLMAVQEKRARAQHKRRREQHHSHSFLRVLFVVGLYCKLQPLQGIPVENEWLLSRKLQNPYRQLHRQLLICGFSFNIHSCKLRS